ncbi:MAG: adenylate/guanylate cyclase domain-containing protein [Thermoanaerobaculia bacterium]|jgi:adenylate cyclase
MSDVSTVRTAPGAGRLDTARALRRRIISIYAQGAVIAVILVLFLVYLGLGLTARQWGFLLGATPFGMLIFIGPDILLIRRHLAPILNVLRMLDRGTQPSEEEASRAKARALNMPFLSAVRVTAVHGPLAAVAVTFLLALENRLFATDYAAWQIFICFTIIFFFASPTHAIFEFFSVSREMHAVIERLSAHARDLRDEDRRTLRSTSIRNKLLYLAIFVSALPLVFLAGSVIFKVDRLLVEVGAQATPEQRLDLRLWVLGVVATCALGAMIMSALTAQEVSRSAEKLIEAMSRVEHGNLDVRLEIVTTDEYAELFRGFNLMVDELREEVRILEMSQSLMGELQLDVLLERIMRATTGLLDADRSTLFLYDKKTDELFSRFAEGLNTKEIPIPRSSSETPMPGGRREIRIPASQGVAGAVFRTGTPANISDPQNDPRFNKEIDERTGYRTRSILAMPIFSKDGHCIGVTQVLNKEKGSFTAKDETRLRAFTAQIAVALENARLFEDVMRIQNYNESILRSTSNGMISLDNERRVATVNDPALRILKTSREAVVGRSTDELLGAANAWIARSIARVEQSGATDINLDADVRLRDRTSASVNLTTVPLRDAKGDSLGSLLILEDITNEKRVRSTMSRYMSKEVAEQLLQEGEGVLGGKSQRISILFSDIRSFTNVAEALGARETVSMLNEYFEQMVEVVFRHGGILDKYIGDAIMALFGAPFEKERDAESAVATANEMIVVLREHNAKRWREGKAPIDIGIGISTGDAIVGSIGSPKRMEYTAIGDSVNLASRLEGATKLYGVKVLVSEFTVGAMKQAVPLRELDLMRVKGKDKPVTIFEALGHHDEASFPNMKDALDYYESGLALYRQQRWTEALQRFDAALRAHPGDGPSKLYKERAAYYLANPPGPAWDRVWTMKEK